jgi:hypothetical protein
VCVVSPVDDEAWRIREHAYACWDGCDDLHTCADCGEQEDVCGDDCGEAYGDLGDDAGYGDAWEPMPVVTVPDISTWGTP